MPYRKSEPVFLNLEAEISKRNIKKKDIAMLLGIDPKTLSLKFLGKNDFKLGEASSLYKAYFSDLPMHELFKRSGEVHSTSPK